VQDLATLEVREERYDKLVLATGAHVRVPEIEGLDGERVHAFRTLADASSVNAVSKGGRSRWVVLGGGFIGLEVAEQLALAGHRVTVLAPGGAMGSRLAPPLQRTVEDALRAVGVGMRDTRATGVRHSAPGAPIAVRTDDGELVGADQVLLATGTSPSSDLAASAGLRIGASGAIATDLNMRTSNSSIWACGDCAEVVHLVTEAPDYIPLSPNAFRTARVAGANAARRGRGAPARFRGAVGAYALKVAGLEIAIAGLSEKDAKQAGFDPVTTSVSHASRAARMAGRSPVDIHLIADQKSRRLLGGQLVGQDGAALRANVLVPLLRERATVEDLYDLDLIYSPPLAPSLDPLLVAARSLQKELDR
jgi:NADPH-dependent 2,4-dienoyl-CoA reductase/sulfur reductase-like enzyme